MRIQIKNYTQINHNSTLKCHVKTFLCFFLLFYFCRRSVFVKTVIENFTENFERHFWNHRNELMGL